MINNLFDTESNSYFKNKDCSTAVKRPVNLMLEFAVPDPFKPLYKQTVLFAMVMIVEGFIHWIDWLWMLTGPMTPPIVVTAIITVFGMGYPFYNFTKESGNQAH